MTQQELMQPPRSIGDVSELTGLEPHVLRYWETEFSVLQPDKNNAGHRVYMPEDVEIIFRIKYLLREEKYTISGARQVLLDEYTDKESSSDSRRELLPLKAFLHTLANGIE